MNVAAHRVKPRRNACQFFKVARIAEGLRFGAAPVGRTRGVLHPEHDHVGGTDATEDIVLVGATTHFPEPAREIMEASVPERMSDADLAEWGRCSSRGEAQTREILAQFHDMKDSYADMNFTEPYLGTITARTLVVHGDRDEFFPIAIPVRMYTSIPTSALWIVPDGGHIPIFGAWAEAFRTEARRFLEGG